MSEKRDELLDAVDHACFQCIHMAKPIRANVDHPAFGWTLSDKAQQEIEAIENNRRMALHSIGNMVLD